MELFGQINYFKAFDYLFVSKILCEFWSLFLAVFSPLKILF